MPDPLTGVLGGGAIIGGVLGGGSERRAIGEASAVQQQSNREAIEEIRRQSEELRELLQPFVTAAVGTEEGGGSLAAQMALIGLAGDEAQTEAIAQLEASPEFEALTRVGEEAILGRASATGGLRGGNVQGALAQFRPQVLSSLIDKQYGRLAGLTSLGQASAAGVGAAGQQSGAQIASILQSGGESAAEAALARGRSRSGTLSGILQGAGILAGGLF